MRHFLPHPVPPLAERVPPAPTPALLVPPPGLELPRPAPTLGTRAPAVAGPLDVAQRAQQQCSPALGRLAADDVKRDHGPPPTPRDSTSARTCATNRVSSRVTSRSRGAIEGSEVNAPGPRYLRRCCWCIATRRSPRLPSQAPRSTRCPRPSPFVADRAAPRVEWRNRAARCRRDRRLPIAARNCR